MKRRRITMLSLMAVVVAIALAVAIPLAAGSNGTQTLGNPGPGVPALINYQGYLTDSTGEPLDGVLTVSFWLYNEEAGGAAFWTEVAGRCPLRRAV